MSTEIRIRGVIVRESSAVSQQNQQLAFSVGLQHRLATGLVKLGTVFRSPPPLPDSSQTVYLAADPLMECERGVRERLGRLGAAFVRRDRVTLAVVAGGGNG